MPAQAIFLKFLLSLKAILIPKQEHLEQVTLFFSVSSLTNTFSVTVDIQFEYKKVNLKQISFITDQIGLLIGTKRSITDQWCRGKTQLCLFRDNILPPEGMTSSLLSLAEEATEVYNVLEDVKT